MQHKIIGSTMPVLEMTLEPGDRIIAEAGELSWMTSSIELHTSTSAGANKGFFGAIKRAVGEPPSEPSLNACSTFVVPSGAISKIVPLPAALSARPMRRFSRGPMAKGRTWRVP